MFHRRIDEAFVKGLNKKGFNLTLGPYIDREDLGFIIKKDKLVMDFAFSKGINALKHIIQSEVSNILFG